MSDTPSTARGLPRPAPAPGGGASAGGWQVDLRMERRPTTEPRRFISTRRCSSMDTLLRRQGEGGREGWANGWVAAGRRCQARAAAVTRAGVILSLGMHSQTPASTTPTPPQEGHSPARGHRRRQQAGRRRERQHQRQRRQRRRRVLVDEVSRRRHIGARGHPLLERQAPPARLAVLRGSETRVPGEGEGRRARRVSDGWRAGWAGRCPHPQSHHRPTPHAREGGVGLWHSDPLPHTHPPAGKR